MLPLFWDVRKVSHVKHRPAQVAASRQRFSKVFTKLRAWELAEFSRVVLLDADLLARKDIVELLGLGLGGLAAVMRGHSDYRPGEKRDHRTFYKPGTKELQGGINAGVIVFEPGKSTFSDMQKAINNPKHRAHPQRSAAPEQDFLTRYFDHQWHGLPRKYNFQLHQLALAGERAEQGSELESLINDPKEIAVFHFSTELKPRDILFSGNEAAWIYNFISEHFKNDVPDRCVRELIRKAVSEWLEEWRQTWNYALEEVLNRSRAGPRCVHCRCEMDLTHCFFGCRIVKELAAQWRHACHRSTIGKADIQRLREPPEPANLIASMNFVSDVYQAWTGNGKSARKGKSAGRGKSAGKGRR